MTTAMTLLAVGLAWYFPIVFFIRSDWNSNSPGRALMTFSTIIASVLTLVVLRQFGVALPNWVRLAVYGAIVVGLALQDVALTKTQNKRSARLAREARERDSIEETSA